MDGRPFWGWFKYRVEDAKGRFLLQDKQGEENIQLINLTLQFIMKCMQEFGVVFLLFIYLVTSISYHQLVWNPYMILQVLQNVAILIHRDSLRFMIF